MATEEGMTKYRVDQKGRTALPKKPRRPHFTGAYAGPLAKRHCTALIIDK